jgi:hypothetical protein
MLKQKNFLSGPFMTSLTSQWIWGWGRSQQISWEKCEKMLPKDFMGKMCKKFTKSFHGKNAQKSCLKTSWGQCTQIFAERFHGKNAHNFSPKDFMGKMWTNFRKKNV